MKTQTNAVAVRSARGRFLGPGERAAVIIRIESESRICSVVTTSNHAARDFSIANALMKSRELEVAIAAHSELCAQVR
jgi:hypothetical protein